MARSGCGIACESLLKIAIAQSVADSSCLVPSPLLHPVADGGLDEGVGGMVSVVAQLSLEVLRRSSPCRKSPGSPFRTAQTATASAPSLACPTTSNSPDPSSMNRRPPLMTGQGIDKCL